MSGFHKPFREIVEYLAQLCREGRTGSLFVATDENRLLQVGLKGGEIVYLVYGTNGTAHILPELRGIRAGNPSFKEGLLPTFRTDLPPTAEILGYLRQVTQQPAATGNLVDHTKSNLENLLSEFVGPMASVLCAEHLRNARDFNSAVQALAQEIDNPQKAAKFRAKARELEAGAT